MNPISSAPKDRPVLLRFPDRTILHPKRDPYVIKGGWIEGFWVADKDWRVDEDGLNGHQVGGWEVLRLPCHGCGCCSSDNQEPDFWMEVPRP
jgi:hypothetical protein